MRKTCLMALLVAAAWGQWDRFRGPNGTGVSESAGLSAEFGPEKNLVWRRELPAGHSSPVISGGRIYLTAVDRGRLYTLCLDSGSGRILWKQEAPRPRQEKLHSLNNRFTDSGERCRERLYVLSRFRPVKLHQGWEGEMATA